MTCQEFVVSLSAYREGELGPAERTRAEEHLAGCVKCAAYKRGYENTIELVRAAVREDSGKPEVPEKLVRSVIALHRKL